MNPVIALVENDLPTNRAFARLLRISGFTVETFLSAEAFLERIDSVRPACVLIDVDLDGMSGLELQSHLKKRHGDIALIVITGRADADTFRQAHALGCSSFLYKPVRAQILIEAIARALSIRPPAI